MRKLAQAIAHEELTLSNGRKMSVVEAIWRSWVVSKEPMLQIKFIEIAFGKVPDTPAANPLENKPTLIISRMSNQSCVEVCSHPTMTMALLSAKKARK